MRAQYLRACAAAGGAYLLSLAVAVWGVPPFDPSQAPFSYAPSVAVSGFNVSGGDQQVYQTWFDPTYWRGDVVAYALDNTGNTDDNSRLWFASEKLAAQNYDTGRKIITRSGTTNVEFRWANLSGTQQTSLGTATTGPQVLNFIRGDRSMEMQFTEVEGDGTVKVLSGSPTGTFRARASVLGDIIHGKPVYVGPPRAGYSFNSYQAYKTAQSARSGVVYVGSNDGMVHAFDASTGATAGNEIFAYIPSMVVGSLKALTTPPATAGDPYPHTYFVDGPLVAGDVTPTAGSTAWKTVLVGGLGAGGQGLFALDVTDATASTETTAKAKILWEVTTASTGFANLGNTYSAPAIVRISDGRWAVVVGNGYYNAGNGHATLLVIDATTGVLIRELDTGEGAPGNPNGLSSPTPVDKDFDGKTDVVYAGDVNGNMWKFDISAASPASWTTPTKVFAAPTGNAPPIIGAPDVADHPLGGSLVYFSTGNLFDPTNSSPNSVQNYVYGIWDGRPAANTALLDQSFDAAGDGKTEMTYTAPGGGGTRRVRVSTANPVNWSDSSGGKTPNMGWRMTLPKYEGVVGTGFIRDGRYHFTSTNPTIDQTAPPDGENWLIELDYLNGATTGRLVFDLSADDALDSDDRVESAAGTRDLTLQGIPVGLYLGPGLFSQPVMVLLDSSFSTTLFNRNPNSSPQDVPGTPGTPPIITPGGVANGHFDFDVYATGGIGSTKHTHEYDDKYDVVGGNFLNASDAAYNLGGTGSLVTAASEFFILTSNGDFSPGVTLTVANQDYKVYRGDAHSWPNKFDGTQDFYTLATVGKFTFRMPVDAFTSKDWGTGIVRSGLQPAVTGCVKGSGTGTLGPNGEIHNGALTIWIVKKGTPASDIRLNVSAATSTDGLDHPEMGYVVNTPANVLHKYTVFWHTGSCYGTAGWTMTPPPDTNKPGSGQASAQGSADPKSGDNLATTPPSGIGSVTTVTTYGAHYNGKSDQTHTDVVTTNYKDNITHDVVTSVYDKKGRLVSKTSKRVVDGTPGTPGVDNGSTTPVYFDPLTAPPQTRGGAKVGRIGWHELIKD